ncbi:MAG: hypothetical protein AAF940_00675 [Pseudomonadota bacterium]
MIQSKNHSQRVRVGFPAVVAVLTAFTVSGCAIVGSGIQTRPNYTAPTPTGIEGNWRNTENVYTASFINNSTQWTSIEDGSILISGSYVQTTTTDYTLQLNSLVTGQSRSANCRLVNINRLNCTGQDGNQFSMVRIANTV